MILVWCFWDKYFVVCYDLCEFLLTIFCCFLLVAIIFFVIVHFGIVSFLVFIFVPLVTWYLFPNYLPVVFLEMSGFVVVIIFLYVLNLFMTEVFSVVPVSTASRAGTHVVGVYIKVILSYLEVLVLDCLFIWSNFTKRLPWILSIIRGSFLSSNYYSRNSTVVWYSSGKFKSMWFVITELSMCTSSFFSSSLSILSSVIHSLVFIVTSSSSHLENFLHSPVLEPPLFGSKFLESFIHASLVSRYLLAFVFASSTIWKQTVSSCVSITSLFDLKWSSLSVETSLSCVLFASYAGIFLSLVNRTCYLFIPSLDVDFPYHIRHFIFHL